MRAGGEMGENCPSKNFQLHVHVHVCICTCMVPHTCIYMYKNTPSWLDQSEHTPWLFQPGCVHSEAAQWRREGRHRRCTAVDPWTVWERSERHQASSTALGSSPPRLGSWTDLVLDSPWWCSCRWPVRLKNLTSITVCIHVARNNHFLGILNYWLMMLEKILSLHPTR